MCLWARAIRSRNARSSRLKNWRLILDRAPKGRVEISERPARERKHDFAYVEMPMSREEAVQECGRCLRCDHFGCGALEGGRIQYV